MLRALYESPYRRQTRVVAINEPADRATVAHLTKYDSTHGRFPGAVALEGEHLLIDGESIALSHLEDPAQLPWQALDIDVVLECSGLYQTGDALQLQLARGARRVLLSQPGEYPLQPIIWGINQQMARAEDRLLSAASCTSNCIVPVMAVLHRAFGIESGVSTTIHSAMNDQPVLDAYHHTDLRKTRAAGHSIIPVDTGLAAGIGRVLPELEGKFSARALRVPTLNVSAMELSVVLERSATVETVNSALEQAARGDLAGILGYSVEPLASCDYNHDPRSGIVDAGQTRVSGRQANVLVWFDNEWGYANRMLDVAHYWCGLAD